MNAGQLRWHCRRGIKELDVLLERWLTQRHELASSSELANFERFLALPDPDLARYLLGHEPAPAEHEAILATILGLGIDTASSPSGATPDHRA
jgi:antitoxin CptB